MADLIARMRVLLGGVSRAGGRAGSGEGAPIRSASADDPAPEAAIAVEESMSDVSTVPAIAEVADYWSGHNVTGHKRFASREESLDYLSWRSDCYPYYDRCLPCDGFSGRRVLDYGCGPGNDLVALGVESPGVALTGADLSGPSLAEAADRLRLHGIEARLVQIAAEETRLPFDDGSFDHVRCIGVVQHTPDEVRVLREFSRILAPGGTLRIMTYNYDSLWTHLYVAYVKRIAEGLYADLDIREAFARTTDGPDCPYARCYTRAEFERLCGQAGFEATRFGCYISAWEMGLLPRRWEAIQELRLPRESRRFLSDLTLDERGIPHWQGEVAGIGLCFDFRKT